MSCKNLAGVMLFVSSGCDCRCYLALLLGVMSSWSRFWSWSVESLSGGYLLGRPLLLGCGSDADVGWSSLGVESFCGLVVGLPLFGLISVASSDLHALSDISSLASASHYTVPIHVFKLWASSIIISYWKALMSGNQKVPKLNASVDCEICVSDCDT